MSDGSILVERRPPASAWVTISNPEKLNAMSTSMWAALDAALAELEEDQGVRVIVLRGAGGKAFVSGADIGEFPDKRNSSAVARDYDALAGRVLGRLRGAKTPTIAMIEGYCLGGGVLIALGCDLRYASNAAVFSIPAARVGLGYDWPATKDLIDAVGGPATKEMLYTARNYSAEQAQCMGLINQAAEVADLEALVSDMAGRIQANAPLTIQAAKAITTELLKTSGEVNLALCDEVAARCSDSADYAEGYAAFLEKRKPDFRGA